MTREEAIETFRTLIRLYGLRWKPYVPPEAWVKLSECNKYLSAEDRRAIARGETPKAGDAPMVKPTPGPLTVRKTNIHAYPYAIHQGAHLLALVTERANAKLFASAPTMLAALRLATSKPNAPDTVLAIGHAIARAEGRTDD